MTYKFHFKWLKMETTKNEKLNSSNTSCGMLTGMFLDRENTEKAYKTLKEKGYTKDDINIVMSDETCKTHFSGNDQKTDLGRKGSDGKNIAPIRESLSSFGIPESQTKLYETGMKRGNIIMGFQPKNDEDAKFFEDNWRTNKGEEIHQK